MFDLAAKRLVWIPIVWKGLVQRSPDALAEPTEFEIQVLAELLTREEMQAIFGGEVSDEDSPEERDRKEAGAKLTSLDRFKKLVSDWRNIKMGGTDAAFTDENIGKLITLPNFALGFDTSYLTAWSGQIALAEKNSADSSGSGPPGEARGSRKTKTGNGRKRTS